MIEHDMEAIDALLLSLQQMKAKQEHLRAELADALFMAYGSELNWPATALDALDERASSADPFA